MDAVYIRLLAYVLSTLLAMVPLSWSSWVAFNAETMTLTVNVQGLAAAIVMALVGAGAIFRKWGTK